MDDSVPSQSAQTGQDSRGRFVAGNKLGKGNPVGRRTAYFRGIFLDCVTELDVQMLKKAIFDAVADGDVAAMKLAAEYAIGKPPTVSDDADDTAAASNGSLVVNLVPTRAANA